LASDYRDQGLGIPQKLSNQYQTFTKRYEALTGEAPATLTGQKPRRTLRRALGGLTDAPERRSVPAPRGTESTADPRSVSTTIPVISAVYDEFADE